jgi:hypothetical protein
MIVETRKTAAGTEYWDAKEKRVRFVPAGKEPGFEVTRNPKSMIMGVDLANGPDKTVINGKVVEDINPFGVNDGENNYQLNEMTVKELKALASRNEIDLPKDVTKRDGIARYIFDNWVPDEE